MKWRWVYYPIEKNTTRSYLSEQDGLEGGVEFHVDVFQKARLAEPHRILQTPQEVAVRQLDHVQRVVALLQVTRSSISLTESNAINTMVMFHLRNW